MLRSLTHIATKPLGTDDRADASSDFENPVLDERLLLPQSTCAIALDISVNALRKWSITPRERRGRQVLYYLPDLFDYREQRDQVRLPLPGAWTG